MTIQPATELTQRVHEGDLEELLRRCHRDELLPLAQALKIKPRGMGLHQLSKALSDTLRRRGGNDVANLFLRGGAGPSYPAVLRDLARRLGVQVPGDIAGAEQALLEWWVGQSWAILAPEQRQAIWDSLEMSPPVPDEGGAVVQKKKPRSLAYYYVDAVTTVSTTAARVVPVVGGCLTLWMMAAPRDDLLLAAVLEVTKLRQVVLHRVTIGVVGSPSSGKDAAIKALFGVDSGNVDPVAGSTTEVEITRLPGATALYVVNTPGLGDVVESVTEEARQVLDHIDVFIYVVNAQGGVQARERDDWGRCRASGRPSLAVVNKIDTLRAEARTRYLDDARGKLSVPEADFLAAAFDPLPQLSEHPIGLGEVQDWIARELSALGKDPTELPWVPGGP